MKTKGKVLLSSIASIALCSSIAVGGTFALFTSESTVNIAVTAGEVNVTATVTGLATSSMGIAQENGAFANGGSAVFDSTTNKLTLTNVTPGDEATFNIVVTNNSNVNIQYRFTWAVDGVLSKALEASVDGVELTSETTEWKTWDTAEEKTKTFNVAVELPVNTGNDYQTEEANVSFYVEAVQANGVDYYGKTAVKTAEELSAALENGETVIFTDDIETEATTTAPYGNKVGIIQNNGGVIDGNGKTLSVECYGDDYGIMTSGGTIKNLTIENGCRAIMIMSPTEDIIIDNVKIGGDGVLYPINTGEKGADGVNLTVTNSTLAGWTSYGPVVESASFTNVKFEQGTYYNDIYGRVLKPYVNTTLTNCSFIEHMNLDLSSLAEGQKVTIDNCTVNGQKVTVDTFTVASSDDDYDTALFSVDLPSWADSIADCVNFPVEVADDEALDSAIAGALPLLNSARATTSFPTLHKAKP